MALQAVTECAVGVGGGESHQTSSCSQQHCLYLTLIAGLERLVLKNTPTLLREGGLYNGVHKLCTDLLTETNPGGTTHTNFFYSLFLGKQIIGLTKWKVKSLVQIWTLSLSKFYKYPELY